MTVKFYMPDGTGPFFAKSAPAGSTQVTTSTDGAVGTGISCNIVVAVDVDTTSSPPNRYLRVKTRPVSDGMVSGAETAWQVVADIT